MLVHFNSMALFDEAEFAFETALACDTNNIESFVNLGAIKSTKNDPFGSIKIYEKALRRLKNINNKQAETIKFYLSFDRDLHYLENPNAKNELMQYY